MLRRGAEEPAQPAAVGAGAVARVCQGLARGAADALPAQHNRQGQTVPAGRRDGEMRWARVAC
eukprot:388889-Prymnesium_polylepis.1